MDAGLAPILFVLVVSMTAVRSQIQRGPANALMKAGDSVTLECVTDNKNCKMVEWQKVEGLQSPKLVYRNGVGMINNDVYPPQRYSVNSTGGCSLTITQLKIGDSGRFICMQVVDDMEPTRSSILIVINVTESCMSNVTSNALAKGDGYSLWCAINIPPKSVEPSNVTLSFHNKAFGETNTTDQNQPPIVKATLTGTAREETIMPRVCRASVSPNTQANYDNTIAILDVCTTQQLIVSYPVENITVPTPTSSTNTDPVENITVSMPTKTFKGTEVPKSIPIKVSSPPSRPHSVEKVTVSTSGPYSNGDTVRYTTDGHPSPTFKSTHSTSGAVVDGDTLEIKDDAGNEYTSTATRTVNGRVTSQSITIEVSSAPPATQPTVRSQIQKGPANALKKVGDNVTLECVTANKNCKEVDWQKVEGLQSPKLVYRNGSGMLNNGVFSPHRHSVNESYGCSLTITQLEINDSGKFICVQQVGKREETRGSILVVIGIWKGPANALKKVGDSVTLECVTINENCDQVEWQKVEGLQSPKLVYRNGIGMLNSDVYPPQRYSVNSTGGCSLTITQLEMNDSGRFICVLAVDSGEETRTAILVVINVTESCRSNVMSNALAKGDGYSLRCAIKVPPKSVEPSNVILSFHYKTVGETETTDEKQLLTVITTLTGTAKQDNITRGCRASFSPNSEANYDNTTATLDVCTTQQLIVSYPVENIAASLLSGTNDTVRCTADGYPSPTFKWTIGKSGPVVYGDTLEIKGDAGDNYTCTATNTVNGKVASQNITIEVSSLPPPPPPPPPPPSPPLPSPDPVENITVSMADPTKSVVDGDTSDAGDKSEYGAKKIGPLESSDNERQHAEAAGCGPGCVAGAVCGCFMGCVVIGGISYGVWKKKKNDRNGEKVDMPPNDAQSSGPPTSNYTPNSEVA